MPYPACRAMHWLRMCLQRNACYAKRQRGRAAACLAAAPPAITITTVNDNLSIEVWLAAAVAPGTLTLNSGATHSIGRHYAITFVDKFTRMLWVEPLGCKLEALAAFSRFKARAELKSGCKVERLRSNNGGKYVSHAFANFLHKHGIAHETTAPYLPQSNGVVERVDHSLVKGVIAMLRQAGAPNPNEKLPLTFIKTAPRTPPC
ncbi:uncharacterized protein JCM10292_003905 [Rhodotorula paludigena]|uniref:uncharacterized protein n=1 Tax=Rhodotorula paludigena TaxID=86838 RepID=UPI003172B1C8